MASKINSLSRIFIINRKDRALSFLVQSIVGGINLILFITLIAGLIVYRSNLQDFHAFVIYFLYGFYVLVYFAFSLTFYFYLKPDLNDQERSYFLVSLIQAMFAINFFTSIHFYLKSGLSNEQKQIALTIIKRRHIKEIVDKAIAQRKLSRAEIEKIQTLLLIAKNKNDSLENVTNYIFQFFEQKKISTDIEVDQKEIIEVGSQL